MQSFVREFFVFFLKEPLHVWDQRVHLVEYPAPSTRTPYKTGRQHIEFVSTRTIKEITNLAGKNHLIQKSYINWETEEYLIREDLTACKVLHKPLWYKIMSEWRIFKTTEDDTSCHNT